MGTFTDDISDMMGDVIEDLGRSIVYVTRGSGTTIDTNTMTRSYAPVPVTVSAVREPSRTGFSGPANSEEFVYTIRKADLGAAITPDRNDQIEDTVGSDTLVLSVTLIETTADDLAWRITARHKRVEA